MVVKNEQKEKHRKILQNHTCGHQDFRQEGVLSGKNFRDSQRGGGGGWYRLYLL